MEANSAEIKVDWKEEEVCVDCGKGLGYPKGTHIALRQYYVSGHGDHCQKCFTTCFFAKLFIER